MRIVEFPYRMKRAGCLIAAFTMALQASGLALTARIFANSDSGSLHVDSISDRYSNDTYANGAYALYTYDGRSRIKAVEHKNSSHTLLRKETNTYDPASRITSRYEGPATGGVTTTFGYDFAGQLTSESSTGYTASYAYDANGNRTSRTVNGVSETYTIDDADKLTKVAWSQGGANYEKNYAYHFSGRPTSVTYKTNGNTTATETMTWDKESRMLTNSLANSSYVYNGFDARVSKTVGSNTTTFKRAGAAPVSPVLSDVLGSTTTRYLPGISSRVGSTSTFSHSGIKNGILQTKSSQTNTATKRYDAFGNELTTTGTWQTRFDYGGAFGYQRDDESGYKLLGHRYYDPEIGRFLTRDLIQDGRNWYDYCANCPTKFADRDGLKHFSVDTVSPAPAGGPYPWERRWWFGVDKPTPESMASFGSVWTSFGGKLLKNQVAAIVPTWAVIGPIPKVLLRKVGLRAAKFKGGSSTTSGLRLLDGATKGKWGNKLFKALADGLHDTAPKSQILIYTVIEGFVISDAIEDTINDDGLWGSKGIGCGPKCGHAP
jgi:RHS repeat-associated protein